MHRRARLAGAGAVIVAVVAVTVVLLRRDDAPASADATVISRPVEGVEPKARPASQTVAVVGDSVIDALERWVGEHGSTAQRSWTVKGASGEGWAAVPGAVGSGSRPLISAAAATHPDVLVLSFGTNDALHAVFADVTGDTAAAQRVRDDTVASIREALTSIASSVPCVLLVTPTNWPSNLFGAGTRYRAEVNPIVDHLRTLASTGAGVSAGTGVSAGAGVSAGRVVAVVDWAEVSLGHHRVDGTSDDWFPDGDEVHPNPAGLTALAALISSTIDASCHPSAG